MDQDMDGDICRTITKIILSKILFKNQGFFKKNQYISVIFTNKNAKEW